MEILTSVEQGLRMLARQEPEIALNLQSLKRDFATILRYLNHLNEVLNEPFSVAIDDNLAAAALDAIAHMDEFRALKDAAEDYFNRIVGMETEITWRQGNPRDYWNHLGGAA